MDRICEHCRETFSAKPGEVAAGRARFCTMRCRGLGTAVSSAVRFAGYVGEPQPSGCRLWLGGRSKKGYGVFRYGQDRGGRMVRATHAAYELGVGPMPEGSHVLHRCDNPPCVNPEHLFLGGHAENAADKVTKGRQPRGQTHPNSKLTERKVLAMRRSFDAGRATQAMLSARYRVSLATVNCVVRRRTWRHVG